MRPFSCVLCCDVFFELETQNDAQWPLRIYIFAQKRPFSSRTRLIQSLRMPNMVRI